MNINPRGLASLAVAWVLMAGVLPGEAANLTWDSSGANPVNAADGSGSWNATTAANWSNGASDILWDNISTAVFGNHNGVAGTVTIDDPSTTVTAAGLTFIAATSGNYTITAAGANTLTLSGLNPIISIPSGLSPIISAPLTGAFGTLATTTVTGLGIAGGGTLNLTGVSSYTGDTYIRDNSTLNLNGTASIGTAGGKIYVGLVATGSTTTDTSMLNMNGTSSITAGTVFIDFNQAAITISTTTGSTLNVNGNNTINADSIIIDAGRANGNTKGGGGVLKLAAGATLTLNGAAGAGNNINLLDIANYNFESGGATSTGTVGTADFSAGTVNGTINTINIATGKVGSGAGAGVASGTLLFANGTLNASTINIARRASSQASAGTLTVAAGGTGTLNAASITFGGGGTVGGTTGVININGATLALTGDITSATTAAANATINLAGGTLDMAGHNIGTGGNPITLVATSGILKGVNFINDTAGLTKTGGGTLTVVGNNAYVGDTTISAGTLLVTGALTGGGTVNVNTTGTLGGSGDGTTTGLAGNVGVNGGAVRAGIAAGDIGKLTTSAFTLHTGGVTVDLGPSFTADLINALGNVTLGDSAASALSLTVAGTPAIGNYEILDYTGSLTKNADFAITGPVGFNYGLNYNTVGKVFLNVTASSNVLTWNGAADQTNWDTTHTNFTNGSGNVQYVDPKSVKFDDTAPAGATNITITGTLSPTAVSVSSSTRNYTFQGTGSIGGAASLTKDGSSTLTVVNNNTYTGVTTINAGILQVGNGGTAGSLGTGAFTVDGTLAYKRSDTVSIASTIGGSGSLQQLGSGTLILTGNNSYGTTLISSGTLQIGSGDVTGSAGTGAVTNNSTLAFNRSDAFTFANPIGGSGGIVQQGPNVVTLSGANTFTGPIAIFPGSTLKVTDSSSLGATSGTTGNLTVAAGGTLDVGAGVDTLNYGTRVFHIQGTGVGNVGAINNSTTNLQQNIFNFITLDGDVTITGSRLDIGNSNAAAVLDLQGHTLTTSMTTGANHLFSIAGGTVTAGQIVVSGGALNIGGISGTASVQADLQGSAITFNSGTNAQFTQTPAGSVTRPMIFLGNNNIGNGAAIPVTVNSNMQLNGNVTFIGMNGGATNTTGNNPLTLLGSISDDSATSGIARSITKAGAHTLTLSGINTYTGNTTITGGTLLLGAANRISDASNLVLSGGTFNTGGFSETLNKLRVTSNSTIDLGAGASILHFAGSSTPGWTGTLTINNWDGNPTDPALGGGADQIFVGNNSFSGLSHTQLNSIQFANQPLGTMLLANGELVPNTSGIPLSTMVPGDYNQNGTFDIGDITAMLQALTDLKAYAISKQISDGDVVAIGDFDNSGTVTNADIQPLLDLAINSGFGSVATVPEPATVTLMLAGLTLSTIRRRKRS